MRSVLHSSLTLGVRVVLQAKEDATELKEKTVALKEKLSEAEAEEQRIAGERDAAIAPIGNLVHDSVPVDDDEVQLPCYSMSFETHCSLCSDNRPLCPALCSTSSLHVTDSGTPR